MQGLNLNVKAGELSRKGTSSTDAQSLEEGVVFEDSRTVAKISVLRCSEMQLCADSIAEYCGR